MTLAPLEDRLLATWPPGQWIDLHVVVAVSGGPDSLALLRLLLAQKKQARGSGQLYVGHVNHQLRGDEAQEDARWVADQCRRLQVPCISRTADVRQRAAVDGDGLEAAARRERYRALTEIAESLGARFVAVGHHADDQLETVLMRLFRGAGLRGLRGMAPTRPLSGSVSLVRPLLGCTRAELREYLDSLGQAYRTDSTNADAELERNRLRLEWLPGLADLFRGHPGEAITRTTEQLAAAQEAIDRLAAELAAECDLCVTPGRQIELTTAPLTSVSPYLAVEALRFSWREAKFSEQAMSYEHWTRLGEVAQEQAAQEHFPGNVQARKAEGRLHLTRRP